MTDEHPTADDGMRNRGQADAATLRADFDRLAALEDGRWDHNRHYHDWLLRRLPAECRSALDVGCGTGDFARLLSMRCGTVTGVDLSPRMIDLARARSRDLGNLRFEVMDVMRDPPPSASFDCVVAIAMLHHLPLRAGLARLRDLVAPGGALLTLDLYRDDGLMESLASLAVLPVSLALRLARSGHLRPPLAARDAWAAHAQHDRYSTLVEVRAACGELLPGAQIRRRLLWRYSLIWRRPT